MCVCVCSHMHVSLGEAEEGVSLQGLEKKSTKAREKRNSSQAHETQGLRWSQFPLQGAFSS